MQSNPPPDWWSRHWRWLIPAGCLTALAGVVGAIAVIAAGVLGLIRASTPYGDALARAQRDPLVISRLGTPIRGGVLLSASLQSSGDSSRARLAIPLEGSRGRGTLYVEARRSGRGWTYSTLTLQAGGAGDRINLLGPTL